MANSYDPINVKILIWILFVSPVNLAFHKMYVYIYKNVKRSFNE